MTRLKTWKMPSIGLRDRMTLIRIGTCVCRPLAEMEECFGPCGNVVLQSTACGGICVSIFLGDKAHCPSTVFHFMILSRYVVSMQYLVCWAVKAATFEHYFMTYCLYVLVFPVSVQLTTNALSTESYQTVSS